MSQEKKVTEEKKVMVDWKELVKLINKYHRPKNYSDKLYFCHMITTAVNEAVNQHSVLQQQVDEVLFPIAQMAAYNSADVELAKNMLESIWSTTYIGVGDVADRVSKTLLLVKDTLTRAKFGPAANNFSNFSLFEQLLNSFRDTIYMIDVEVPDFKWPTDIMPTTENFCKMAEEIRTKYLVDIGSGMEDDYETEVRTAFCVILSENGPKRLAGTMKILKELYDVSVELEKELLSKVSDNLPTVGDTSGDFSLYQRFL